MYSGVPTAIPIAVTGPLFHRLCSFEGRTLANPKSSTLTKSSRPATDSKMMLPGFRSRWMIPWTCASSTAVRIWMTMSIALVGDSARSSCRTRSSGLPGMNSSTR